MRNVLLCSALLLSLPLVAQQTTPEMPVSPQTREAVQRIIGETVVNGQAYEYDRQLADEIGPRLTGSPNYLKAVQWGEAKFRELGLTDVHTETFRMDTWEPEGPATGRIVSPVEHRLHLWSYGWSPSTPNKGVEGTVVYLPSFTANGLNAMKDKIRGNIVFFDRKSLPEHFGFPQFLDAMAALKKLEPAAMLTGGGPNGTETMSGTSADGTLSTYPVAQIGAEDLSLLKRISEHGPVKMEMKFTNRTRTNVEVPQVIGDLRGSAQPDEVVIVGGHLDSWQAGTGAQDNGTGSATVVDVARTFHALGLVPRRTVRFMLFGGEEEGLLGSTAYVRAHRADLAKIDAVLVSDSGAETAKGWLVMGRDDEKDALKQVMPMLSGIGADDLSSNTEFVFQTDHAGFDLLGVPTLVLETELTKYFTLHHKASDTFDSVNKATLLQGDAVVAATAYAIADSSAAFAPHLDQTGVEAMMKKAGKLDEYKAMQAAKVVP